VVDLLADDDKLDPAPGLLNEQQRRELELPCGAWVGFSSLTPRRPTQTTVFVLAERGMAGRTLWKSTCRHTTCEHFPAAEPLNLSEFPSSRGLEHVSASRLRDMPVLVLQLTGWSRRYMSSTMQQPARRHE
jgi:hypothetical protein